MMKDIKTTIDFQCVSHEVHSEIDRAIDEKWTLGQLVDHHISPESHNFSPHIKQTYIVEGDRTFHDLCHPLVALTYKKLSLDTSEFRFWYNGNHGAEAMVVPLELFFNDMTQTRHRLSKENYGSKVRRYYRDNIMKDRLMLERAIIITNHWNRPTSIFNICRLAKFESERLTLGVAKVKKSNNGKIPKFNLTKTKWGEVIKSNLPASDDFADAVYDTLRPGLNYIRNTVLSPDPSQNSRLLLKSRVDSIQVDEIWSAIDGYRPIKKLSATI